MITPVDVIAYSVFQAVKDRPLELLDQDIIEATVEIEKIAGHDFTDAGYDPLPAKAKLAFLKMAQFFALINSDESLTKGIKSEKIGDYSYTLSDGNTVRKPDVFDLLKEYIIEEPVAEKNISLRMRSI